MNELFYTNDGTRTSRVPISVNGFGVGANEVYDEYSTNLSGNNSLNPTQKQPVTVDQDWPTVPSSGCFRDADGHVAHRMVPHGYIEGNAGMYEASQHSFSLAPALFVPTQMSAGGATSRYNASRKSSF